jgi:hypothetical protein
MEVPWGQLIVIPAITHYRLITDPRKYPPTHEHPEFYYLKPCYGEMSFRANVDVMVGQHIDTLWVVTDMESYRRICPRPIKPTK